MHKINELIIIVSIQVKTKPTQKNFKRGKDPSLRTLNKKFHHLDIMIHVKSNQLSKISTINKCRSIQMESAVPRWNQNMCLIKSKINLPCGIT